jgi:hypothetical protein
MSSAQPTPILRHEFHLHQKRNERVSETRKLKTLQEKLQAISQKKPMARAD